MPEIKHNFTGGKMNKDLDERLVPNGEYRDAMNIQVSTSEGSDIGTIQNILGNKRFDHDNQLLLGSEIVKGGKTIYIPAVCVGSVVDEKEDMVYWLAHSPARDYILRKNVRTQDPIEFVFVDTKAGTGSSVLKFNNDGEYIVDKNNPFPRLITGINIVDGMLFWTDNYSEPKKINIKRSIQGTIQNPNSLSHTKLINEDVGITMSSNVTDIEEKHITVIKKAPSRGLSLKFNHLAGRDPELNYAAIVRITEDPGTLLNTSSLFVPGKQTDSNDFSPFSIGDDLYLWIETDLEGNSDFFDDTVNAIPQSFSYPGKDKSLQWQVGDKVVLKEFNDGIAPATPIQDYRIKATIVASNTNSFEQNTATPNYGTSYSAFPQWSIGRASVKLQIDSINGFPPVAPAGLGAMSLKYVIDKFDDEKKIYEFKFPRFSFRYKYEDGEYSTFAPFSEIAFKPGSFDHHPKKGYNLGMTNRLQDVLVSGFKPDDIPKDVVEVDILYKEETSTVIYVVETIKPTDTTTSAVPSGFNNNWDYGSYLITSETIKGAVPANQFLRPFDNVPRSALAQDVTGSRIVYANYLQNYNLNPTDNQSNNFDPNMSTSLNSVDNNIANPIKSVKSLREYQLGVVFVDQYGRETPVLSNSTGTIKLPKQTALTGNRFNVAFDGAPPAVMTHFKFYVKEAAGEYYNMAMDRFYDAEDGNIWLAFPSSDRNKIDIDTFLILKKGTERNSPVPDPARYKVLAIESEAPDHIKTSKLLISEKTHTTSGANPQNIFEASNMDTAPEVGSDEFEIFYEPFSQSSGGDLDTLIRPGVQLYVEFAMAGENEVSDRYKVTQVTSDWMGVGAQTAATGNVTDISEARYYIKVAKQFGADVNFITDDPSGFASTKINDTAQVRFYKYEVENSPQFDGRFFVKIYKDGVFNQYVKKLFTDANDYKITAKAEVYSLSSDMHKPEFMGGSVQMFGKWVDKTTHNGASLPWVNNGIAIFNPDASAITSAGFLISSNQWENMWLYEQFTNGGYYGQTTVPDINFVHRDPNRDGGTWRGMEFDMWMLDGAWQFQGNLSTLGMPSGTHMMQTPNLDDIYECMGQTGPCLDDFLWLGDDFNEKPAKDIDKWFIDTGHKRAYTKPQFGDDLSNGAHYGINAPVPGGYKNNGIQVVSGGTQNKLNLSFGPIYGDLNSPSYPVPDFFRLGDGGPEYARVDDFISKIKPGATIRWKEDPTQTIYTIQGNITEQNNLRYTKQASNGKFPSNYSKRYQITIDPRMDEIWDPFKAPFKPIANGLDITLPVTNDMASQVSGAADLGNCYITMDSIIGVDAVSGLEAQIIPGMIITHFDSDGDVSNTTDTGLHVNNFTSQQLLIDEIEYDIISQKYRLYITGYEWPLTIGDIQAFSIPAPPTVRNVRFRQASVNHVSPEWCNNFNRVQEGAVNGHYYPRNTLGAVGYQFEFVEPIDTEEIIPDYPAIWETEPKEQTELDIYYEVGGANPIELNIDTIKTAIPIGSTLQRHFSGTSSSVFQLPFGEDVTVIGHRENAAAATLQGAVLLDLDNEINGLTGNSNFYSGQFGNNPQVLITRPDGTQFGPISVLALSTTNYPATGGNHSIEVQYINLYNDVFYRLPYFNCYSFGNGVESNRIRDNFNLPFISNGVKASTTISEPYQEERRKSGLIYSGLYNSTTGINNLNQFIAAEKITKDINPIYGSIQKIHSRDSDLVALCEDKIIKILANKDAVFNADGNPQLIATPNVLGQTIPFTGEYGISKNPESFASESYRSYFTDTQRGVVLRLSKDGLTPISDYGMKDWFRDHLALKPSESFDGDEVLQGEISSQLLGSYDTRNDEYNIKVAYKSDNTSTGGYTSKVVSFREDIKGWVSFKSFLRKENGISVSSKYITFYNGVPWEHYREDVDRNNFYSAFTASSFNVLLNDSPSVVKTFNTLNYEGSQSKVNEFIEYIDSDGNMHTDKDYYNLTDVNGWHVNYIKTDLQDGSVPEFIDKENKWFNYIRGTEINTNPDGLITSVIEEDEFSFQGLGTVSSSDVFTSIYGCTDINFLQYNPNATIDDGSCADLAVVGCTNPNALNYNPLANNDDGSCQIPGCTDISAFNYNSNATVDDGSCMPFIYGCNTASVITGMGATPDVNGICANGVDISNNPPTPFACGTLCGGCFIYGNHPGYDVANYDPNVNTLSNCTPLPSGCADPNASNYDSSAVLPDGSCEFIGCTDPNAINYDPFALVDDGSCCSSQGCQDPAAFNYDPAHCIPCVDDNGVENGYAGGTCCIPCTWGCMQVGDPSYDPNATCNDPNMCTGVAGCTDPNASNTVATSGTVVLDGSCIFTGCLDPQNDAYYGDDCTTLVGVNGNTASTFDNGGAGCLIPNYAVSTSVPTYTAEGLLTHDASLCIFYGCMLQQDANGNLAANYDPNANTPCNAAGTGPGNNDCCVFTILGCTDNTTITVNGVNYPAVTNYDSSANTDDGSCIPTVVGCTDPNASNYVQSANTDDGSCITPVMGCMDDSVGLWNDINGDNRFFNTITQTQQPGFGPCNDPVVTIDPITGIDLYSVPPNGCVGNTVSGTNQDYAEGYLAKNFNPQATADDGNQCEYVTGCTDPTMYSSLLSNYSVPFGSPVAFGISSGNSADCIPFIKGCLDQEYENLTTGQTEYNYNVNSGPYSMNSTNPNGTQGWSQSPVVRTGDNQFDVNTHDSFACVPCDTPDCEYPAGCVANLNNPSAPFAPATANNFNVNYQYGNGVFVLGDDSLPGAQGPYTMQTSQPVNYLITQGAGTGQQWQIPNGQGGLMSVPFNYDEQWTEAYTALVNLGILGASWDDWGITGDIQAYGGNFDWDVSNHNACCNVSGCAHPYALNFDLKGWKRNPANLSQPLYVGIGLPFYNPSIDTGRVCRTCPEPMAGGAVKSGKNIALYFKEENGVYSVNEDYYPLNDTVVYNTSSSNDSIWKMTDDMHKCCHFEGFSVNGPVGCTNPNACYIPPSMTQFYSNYNPNAVFDDGSCCVATPINQGGSGNCQACSGQWELPNDPKKK